MNGDNDGGTRRVAGPAGVGSATPTVTEEEASARYLAGVREALADLPAPEVAEILDDVRAHLADLSGELDAPDLGALTARLGSPATYATELRAAAGYPPAPAAQKVDTEMVRPGQARLAVIGLAVATLLLLMVVAALAPFLVLLAILSVVLVLPFVLRDGPRVPTIAALPEVRQLTTAVPATGAVRTLADFVGSLQPAWWLVRAVMAAWLLVAVIGSGWLVVLVAAALAIPVSIWLGRRSRRDRRWLWLVVPLNGLAAAIVLFVASSWTSPYSSPSPSPSPSADYGEPSSPSGLWQDGELVRDIRPVDTSGNPLSGVYLFDQDGRPINTSIHGEDCHPGLSDPGVPIDPASPYPRGTVEYSGTMEGACVFVPPGPLVVAVPSGPPPPSVLPTTPPPTPTAPVPPTG